MAYRLEANLLFGFQNSLVNMFLQVFNNASLDVNVLTVAESSQDLTPNALYLSLCILKEVQFPSSTFTNTTNNTQIPVSAAPQLRRLFEGGAYA